MDKILNGSISDAEQFATMYLTGGLNLLFDFDVALLTQVGRQAPSNARTLIRRLTESVYNGGATGFSYADLDNVKMIVSSAFPTAGLYLALDSTTLAVTLGPVIILQSWLYDALFSGANRFVTYDQFVADPSVCMRYIGAIDTLIHELVHVKQFRNLGSYNYYTQYVSSTLGRNGYAGSGFEHEAFEYQIMIAELQGGRYCSVMARFDNRSISTYGLSAPTNTCPDTGITITGFPPCP